MDVRMQMEYLRINNYCININNSGHDDEKILIYLCNMEHLAIQLYKCTIHDYFAIQFELIFFLFNQENWKHRSYFAKIFLINLKFNF